MQAVIRTGGKQYYVAPGDILEVEKLAGAIGETIALADVLMIANDEDITVGQPTIEDASVVAKITGQYRGTKIQVFRYRPKKRIRVRRGHRQYLTRLEIQSIKMGDQEFVAPVVEAPEIVTPAPVIEDSTIEDVAATVSAPAVVAAGDEPVESETAEQIIAATEDPNAATASTDEAEAGDDAEAKAGQ
jgi:large subunit ribosomal protein L21